MKRVILLAALVGLFASFTHRDITWVAIGDSITYLNDHLNETGDRVKKGYLTRVTEQLPNIHYINQGHNGWTAGGIADGFDKLGVVKADVYTVFLGTNDWWGGRPIGTLSDYQQGTGSKTVYGSFRIIIDRLRAINPDAVIKLITPMQRMDFVYIGNYKNNAWGSYKDKNGQRLEQVADAVSEIGKQEHLQVIDLYHLRALRLSRLVKFKRLRDPQTGVYRDYIYPESDGIPFDPSRDEYPYPVESIGMTYDGLHPSDEGNAVIAEAVIKALKRVR